MSDHPASASPPYRAVALACREGRLALSGGGVLKLAAGVACPRNVAGRIIAIEVRDGAVVAIAAPPPPDAAPIVDLARDAYVVPPPHGDAGGSEVAVEIVVEVPPRTPATDDVYVSTERSNWGASEIRMDRIDVRRWRATLQLRRGSRLAFRITRGSLGTAERENSGAVPSPHVVVAEPNARIVVRISAWADVT